MGIKEKEQVEKLFETDKEKSKKLILHNDDHNYFDFVIEALIQICAHTAEQAEQCAMIVHYKGKCDIKEGAFEKLKPMKEALTDRGLNATIE